MTIYENQTQVEENPIEEKVEIEETQVLVESDANDTMVIDYIMGGITDKEFDLHCYSTYNPPGEPLVIRKLDKPAIIYVSAYEEGTWQIVAESPEDILAVVIRGFEKQNIENSEFKTFVIHDTSFFNMAGLHENETLEYAESVHGLWGGMEPTTIWNEEPEIDGKRSVIPVGKSVDFNSDVVLKHYTGESYQGGGYFDDGISIYPKNVAGYTGGMVGFQFYD